MNELTERFLRGNIKGYNERTDTLHKIKGEFKK